jgi:hypothetical protein
MTRSASCSSRPSLPWRSSWHSPFNRRSRSVSRRQIACATARSSVRSTKPISPVTGTCRSTHILNERGLRTGAGDAFDPISVQWVRFSAKLKSLKERLLEAGMLTSKQLCAQLGVCRSTLARWRQEGRIKARICNDIGEWLYWPPETSQPPPGPSSTPSDRMVTSTAGGAV